MTVQYDQGAGQGRRAGLIVLSTDETLEYEARIALADQEINLLHARIPSHPEVTQATLALMEQDLPRTAALLPQGLCAIGYGCTSGATVIGPETVQKAVQSVHPGIAVTNPLSALIAQCRALSATRLGLVTPYVPEVSHALKNALGAAGIEVLNEMHFGVCEDQAVARISEQTTRAALVDIGQSKGIEAVFASCTNLRTFGILQDVSRQTGLPALSSNQVLLWHLSQLVAAQPGT